jgi:hypothetical protein
MALIREIVKGLEALTAADLDQLAPAERRRLADLLRHLAGIADKGEPPKGVLGDLANGERGDG